MAGHRLIIAEKPSVARDIAKVLGVRGRGQGYLGGGDTRVSWCVGHLIQLADPVQYKPEWRSWDLEHLPLLPDTFHLKARSEGADQWEVVRGLLRDGELREVVNACDAGREGELIFAWVYEHAGCTAPVRRLWISSMTDSAISAGFEKLAEGSAYANLEAAARCRSEADWLVGLNATRAMTTRMRSGPNSVLLSVGRVQTPTLALIADRETEIEQFEPRDFWQIKARFEADKGNWDALWTASDTAKESDSGDDAPDRVWDKAQAEAILERVQGQPGQVVRVKRVKSQERPPLLYDLTSLQKECNRRFKYSAKKTLELAQSLYERHKLLTYPRTDSRHLGTDQVEGLPERLRGVAFGPYAEVAEETLARWPVKLDKRVIDDAEVSDHHAIVPTGVDPRTCSLSVEEKRVFDLVARRFLAVMQPAAVFAVATVVAAVGKDRFIARGRTCLEEGWRRIDPPRTTKKQLLLPPVDKGDAAVLAEAKLHQGRTQPPRRFTEATLLAAMESAGESIADAELKRAMKRNGLGTAATRAAIIETLLTRRYIERQDANLVPTSQGRALLAVLPVPVLRSPRLTGQWEARLVAMAEGKEDRQTFMSDVRRFASEVVEAICSAELDPAAQSAFKAPPPEGEVLGACPRCQEEVRQGPRGWGCTACTLFIGATVARREVSPTMARQLLKQGCTAVVKGFRSKAGKPFEAALALDEDGKVVFRFPEPDAIGACPACGQPVRARGKVYTCDTGRSCAFVVFAEMSAKAITEAHVRELLAEGRTALIQGFAGRDQVAFDGRLVWESGRVRVQRESAPRENSEQRSDRPDPPEGRDGRW